MNSAHPSEAVIVARNPVHAALTSFPVACFTLTLLSDIAYWRTSNLLWQHFSEWLLLAGLVFGAFAVIARAVDFLFRRDMRASGFLWPYAIGSVLVFILAFLNSLVHAADGWTGVVPYGLILSGATVIVMLVTSWFGHARVRRRAGVIRHE